MYFVRTYNYGGGVDDDPDPFAPMNDLAIVTEVKTDFNPDEIPGCGTGTKYLPLKRGDSVRIFALNRESILLPRSGGWVYGRLARDGSKDGWFPRSVLGPDFTLIHIEQDSLYEYSANKASIALSAGDIVYVEQEHESGWTLGRKTNKDGLFVERGWFVYDLYRPKVLDPNA